MMADLTSSASARSSASLSLTPLSRKCILAYWKIDQDCVDAVWQVFIAFIDNNVKNIY